MAPPKNMTACAVVDCENVSLTRGLCKKHYMRKLRLGSATAVVAKTGRHARERAPRKLTNYDRLALRSVTADEPLRQRDSSPTAVAIPSPSCLGGAHRRCLLIAAECPCDCHREQYVYRAPARARATFPCPVCHIDCESPAARVAHVAECHPVTTTLDDEGIPGPRPVLTLFVCVHCGLRVGNLGGLKTHVARKHALVLERS